MLLTGINKNMFPTMTQSHWNWKYSNLNNNKRFPKCTLPFLYSYSWWQNKTNKQKTLGSFDYICFLPESILPGTYVFPLSLSFFLTAAWCQNVFSRSVMSDSCNPMDCSPPGSSVHCPSNNTGVGCHLLHGIFPTQGLNPSVPHCRQILYHLSHQRSPVSG